MAIDAYIGLPGHGKSYGVVEHVIIPSLKQDRLVVTNIPLDVEALLMDFGGNIKQLDDEWHKLTDLNSVAPNGCVLVLDEVWARWPSGMRQDDLSACDGELLMKHRHKVDKNNKSMRIVLVTQDLSQIASAVRALVETTYRMSKLTKKRFRVDIFKGAVTGLKPPKTALIRQTVGTYKDSVYRYYKSATQSATGDVGDETSADNRNNPFKSYTLWAIICGFLVLSAIAFNGIRNYFGQADNVKPVVTEQKQHKTATKETKDIVKAAPHETAKEPSRLERIATPNTVEYAPSTLWRVGGYLGDFTKTETMNVILVNVNNLKRRIPFDNYCKFIDGGYSVSCIVDKELITEWTGSGIVSQVLETSSVLTN